MKKSLVIRRLLLGISTSFPFFAFAQIKDSIPAAKQQSYPLEKPFVLQYDRINNAEYTTSDRNGQILKEGKAQVSRFRAFGSFKIYQKEKLTLSTSLLYTHENITNYTRTVSENSLAKNTFNTNDVDLMVNGFYRSTLWNRPLIHSASVVIASPNVFDVKKVFALVSSSVVFVKGPQTRYTLGLALALDLSAIIPVLPVVTYWHRFDNPLWEVDVALPQKAVLRRADFLKGWLTVGTELYGNGFFATESTNLQGNYEYRYTELYSGLGYERLVGKLLIGARTGFRSTIQGRMLKVYNRNNDYLFDTKNSTVPYLNLSVSLAMPQLFKRNVK
jgi:hypothetical protein